MNDTFFDSERMTMTEAIQTTIQSLQAYRGKHDHWAIAFSGGKDSTCVASLIPHLLRCGKIPKPKTLTVLYADTRMELPPLQASAMGVMDMLRKTGIDCRIVYPKMEDRFFVYMFGRGVPPPSNTFRWCTPQIKIEPMMLALEGLKSELGGKFLMLTGVRIGESAARDARIALSCGKNGSECGQGWFQETTPEKLADTLAPILHWRVCLVWKWLQTYAPELGYPTAQIADAYGGDEAEEINARTGCVGCNLASRDFALEAILKNPKWHYLEPLMRLRPLYAELKKPARRLRKTGRELRKDGNLVANPNRMGPLTLEARLWGLGEVLAIQSNINQEAKRIGMPEYSLIDEVEQNTIEDMIANNVWPNGWSGEEARADEIFDEIGKDGSVQDNFLRRLQV